MQGLRLTDTNGDVRIGLVTDRFGPRLNLWDDNGSKRAMLSADKDGATLTLLDEIGKTIWQAPR